MLKNFWKEHLLTNGSINCKPKTRACFFRQLPTQVVVCTAVVVVEFSLVRKKITKSCLFGGILTVFLKVFRRYYKIEISVLTQLSLIMRVTVWYIYYFSNLTPFILVSNWYVYMNPGILGTRRTVKK